ncbi:hypothetical protein EXIGLDRAFT_835167 [Exidia glandulosa HHB12029]|uniref:Uncharacterized protein n=1 Tax=Exidia glandulosa HHB12029 TaxID=1314781 RepID=A0A165J1Q4_EXIGL|nr:hypothetical protein EXIGLDRAFT_835167 [Exidia glandulosa HHB12029]
MQDCEQPTFSQWPRSGSDWLGEFVLFSLDPIASVAPLDDALASNAAITLPRTKYLAVITHVPGVWVVTGPNREMRLNFDFYLVAPGLPTSTPTYSVPIAPTLTHPSGRSAVSPTGNLPWSNLYVHSLCSFEGVVSRLHYRTAIASPARLPEDDHLALMGYCADDSLAEDALNPPSVDEIVQPPPEARDWAGSSAGRTESVSEAEVDREPRELGLEEVEEKLAQLHIFVELWFDFDLGSAPVVLGDPSDALLEIEKVHEIWAEWEERRTAELRAKKPSTNDWLTGVAAGVEEETGSVHGSDIVREPLDDVAISPEDAVDYRLEQSATDGARGSGRKELPVVSGSSAPPGVPHALPLPASAQLERIKEASTAKPSNADDTSSSTKNQVPTVQGRKRPFSLLSFVRSAAARVKTKARRLLER